MHDQFAMQNFSLQRSLSYRLHLLHKITDLESQNAYPREAGLPLSEGRCLAAIGSFAPLSVNTLASRANLTKGQASRAAQSLADQGLIRKRSNARDGRGIEISLTAKGQAVWKKTMALVHARNIAIFGCLSAKEQQQLSTLFDRLIDHNSSLTRP